MINTVAQKESPRSYRLDYGSLKILVADIRTLFSDSYPALFHRSFTSTNLNVEKEEKEGQRI